MEKGTSPSHFVIKKCIFYIIYCDPSQAVARTRPVYRPPARVHGRAYYYNRYDNYYRGGTVLAATVAGLAVGAMVASIPPSCATVIRGGIEYRKCGDTYYQQSFKGSDVVYVVVPAP